MFFASSSLKCKRPRSSSYLACTFYHLPFTFDHLRAIPIPVGLHQSKLVFAYFPSNVKSTVDEYTIDNP